MEKLSNTLYIVGAGDYGEAIPYCSPDCEKWVLTKAYMRLKNTGTKDEAFSNTRIFEIHTMDTRPPHVLQLLAETTLQVIAQRKFAILKYPIVYPKDEIIAYYKPKFDTTDRRSRYFMCSLSYMIALAAYMGYKHVFLRGTNMLMDGDIQKYSAEYWLGKFPKETILDISPFCDLLKCDKLYGYEANNTLGVCQSRIVNEINTQIMQKLHFVTKELQDISRLQKILTIDRSALMKEIIARHGVTPGKWQDEDDE